MIKTASFSAENSLDVAVVIDVPYPAHRIPINPVIMPVPADPLQKLGKF